MSKENRIYAVAGSPVLHSQSPDMFNQAFKSAGYPACYCRLAAGSVEEVLFLSREIGMSGLNITAPFKTGIKNFVQPGHDLVNAADSVNTIVAEGSELTGFNTDPQGAVGALEQARVRIRNSNCLVLGTGGAGRSAALGLAQHQGKVTLVNRTYSKAAEFASRHKLSAAPFADLGSVLTAADIFVSAIPVDPRLPENLKVNPDLVVLNAAYTKSSLESFANKYKLRYISGLFWLLNQAIPAYTYFTKSQPDHQVMKSALLKPRQNKENIALTGFMGCGKTTIGRMLAKKIGYSFIDSDSLIEKRAEMSIPEIFSQKGEDYFRSLETETLQELTGEKNKVISLGGGIVEREQNRNWLENNCQVIWLYTKISTAMSRINPSDRPLLKSRNPIGLARALLQLRLPGYADVSDLIISNENNPEEVCNRIHEEISLTW